METTTKTINLNNHDYVFTFVNEYKSTRYGFLHHTYLLLNNSELSNAKINYINRTWESYPYQTSMYQAVNNKLNAYIEFYKKLYLERNDYKRMTKQRKEEFEKELNERINIQVLNKLLKEI